MEKKGLTLLKKGFSIFLKGLHLVATLQVKEVKALNTCTPMNPTTKLKKDLKTSKKS